MRRLEAALAVVIEMVFIVLRGVNKTNSRISVLDDMRADFVLFRDLFGRIPRDMVLEKTRSEG